jgi:hypothetical protein
MNFNDLDRELSKMWTKTEIALFSLVALVIVVLTTCAVIFG